MNTIISIRPTEKEVQVREIKREKRRKEIDKYDTDDPFYQEDEEVFIEVFKCDYDNYYCYAGDVVEGSQREEKEETKPKKEKKENIKEGFLLYREESIHFLLSAEESQLDKIVEDLVIADIVTSQAPNKTDLLNEIQPELSPEKYKAIESIINNKYTYKYLQKYLEGVTEEKTEILARIKEEIEREKERIDKEETGDPETRYSKIHLNNTLLDLLSLYSEKEYIIYYVSLYISGKKRVLEHALKKQIFMELLRLFPAGFGANGSLGKKIASYALKKRIRTQKRLHGDDIEEETEETDSSESKKHLSKESTNIPIEKNTQNKTTIIKEKEIPSGKRDDKEDNKQELEESQESKALESDILLDSGDISDINSLRTQTSHSLGTQEVFGATETSLGHSHKESSNTQTAYTPGTTDILQSDNVPRSPSSISHLDHPTLVPSKVHTLPEENSPVLSTPVRQKRKYVRKAPLQKPTPKKIQPSLDTIPISISSGSEVPQDSTSQDKPSSSGTITLSDTQDTPSKRQD
ncbi:hypothetical protein NEOKW01_0702 [Nematocida sp. AWRm80]|nr:hypothetical protein NEOKW01_0702 [Nematocida sp. AWRm80]